MRLEILYHVNKKQSFVQCKISHKRSLYNVLAIDSTLSIIIAGSCVLSISIPSWSKEIRVCICAAIVITYLRNANYTLREAQMDGLRD